MPNDPAITTGSLADQAWMKDQLDQLRFEHRQELDRVLLTLIECADDMRRLSAPQEPQGESQEWRQALTVLHDKLLQRMDELGLRQIATVGHSLDLRRHHVHDVVDQTGIPESIVDEAQAGYLYRDRVLRLAEVITIGTGEAAASSTAKAQDKQA